MNLEEDNVGIITLGNYKDIKEGDKVVRTNRIIEVPVEELWKGNQSFRYSLRRKG